MKRIRQFVNRLLGRASLEQGARRKGATVWVLMEVSLLVAGIALVGFYGAARLESYISSTTALKTFQSIESLDDSSIVPSMERTFAAEQTGDGRIAEDTPALLRKMATDRSTPLGVLEIPRIHLQAPLLEGTDALTLNRGVGRIAGTARPGEDGNIGIAGHRDGFFRPLRNIKAGDAIKLRTAVGTDTYVVDRFQIVSPRDVEVLQAEATPSLTLVTCYPFYFVGNAPKRFVVTAFLTNHAAAGSTKSSPRSFHQPSSSTMEVQ